MELKLTADKTLLDAIERLIEALNVNGGFAPAPVAVPAEEPEAEPAPQEEPAKAEPEPAKEEPAAPAYSKDEVQRMAIKKIQAGNRDAVKDLIEKYGAKRVGDVAEDKLAAFAAELEAI